MRCLTQLNVASRTILRVIATEAAIDAMSGLSAIATELWTSLIDDIERKEAANYCSPLDISWKSPPMAMVPPAIVVAAVPTVVVATVPTIVMATTAMMAPPMPVTAFDLNNRDGDAVGSARCYTR
jgi:hypothetical protein